MDLTHTLLWWFKIIITSIFVLCRYLVVQSVSRVQLFATPWTAACQTSLFVTISWSLLKFLSIESVMPSNHLILCHPLLLPSVFPSIRVVSPSSEYSGLISFRTDWLDLLAVQGTLKESSPPSQFEDISFLALSLFYCPAFISVCDNWKNHSFDYSGLITTCSLYQLNFNCLL